MWFILQKQLPVPHINPLIKFTANSLEHGHFLESQAFVQGDAAVVGLCDAADDHL